MVLTKKRKSRKGGSMLMDVALSLAFVITMVAYVAINQRKEQTDQQDQMMAANVEIMTTVAKSYLNERYEDIRDKLAYPAAGLSASYKMRLVMTPQDLADAGYLSPSLVDKDGELRNPFGQKFRFYLRPVMRSDTSWPQATMTKSQINVLMANDANGNPKLLNGIYEESNNDDEMEIESVIVSEGGEKIPIRRAPNITSHSGSPTIGVINANGASAEASGNLGGFVMPMRRWTEIGATAQEGRLLSLVSLSGKLNDDASVQEPDLTPTLRRCYDLTVPTEIQTCLDDGNKMYSNIVFNNIGTGNVVFENYPGIEGLKKVSCINSNSANNPATVRDSSDFIYIDCGNAIFSDNVEIRGGDLNMTNGDVNVDKGDVTVTEGDVSLTNGNLIVNGNEISNNLIMASGTVLNGSVSPAVTERCPLNTSGVRRTYKVATWVGELIEPVGRSISGYRTTYRTAASPRGMGGLTSNPNTSTGQFIVDVVAFVNEDFCSNVSGAGVLSPNNAAGGMTTSNFEDHDGKWIFKGCGTGGSYSPDGYPDAYFLNNGQATINYAVYCQ